MPEEKFPYRRRGEPEGIFGPHVGDSVRVRVVHNARPFSREGDMAEVIGVSFPKYSPYGWFESLFPTKSDVDYEVRFPDGSTAVYPGQTITPVRASWRARAHVRRNYIRTGHWLGESQGRH